MAIKLTDSGVEKSTITEIREDLQEKAYSSIKDFSNLPSSIQNNLIDEASIIVNEFEDMITNCMNGVSPAYANDFIISQLGAAFGVKRKDKSLQNVMIEWTGLAGVIIPSGSQVASEDGVYIFSTAEQCVIREDGKATVNAIADDYYDKVIDAHTLNVMITDIANIESCDNPNSSSEPIAEESITEYRARVQNRCLANRSGTVATLHDNLLKVQGVSSRLITYRTDTEIKEGYRINTIEIVVGGGDDYQVAEAIFNAILFPENLTSKPSDNDTARKVLKNVIFNEVEFPIIFTRPIIKNISISISLSVKAGYINIPKEAMRELLLTVFQNYINNLKIGYSPSVNSFNNLIYDVFLDNNYSLDIITGITYALNIDDKTVQFNSEGQLDIVEFDMAFKLFNFELNFIGGQV